MRVLGFLLFLGFIFGEYSEYQYLDDLAALSGTDKGSTGHNYTELYASLFAPMKSQPIKFLEIGIDKGASAHLWDLYFPNADLYFIDIRFTDIEYFSPRTKYYLVDQESTKELAEFIRQTGGDFDIILDDGGHKMGQQIVSFETLFPHLKSGGIYIIEDLHTSYWKEFGGYGSKETPLSGPGTTVEFLKSLVENVNFIGASTGYANVNKMSSSEKETLTNYQHDIYSIQFFNSLCVIKKR